jgi:hypothetical protein
MSNHRRLKITNDRFSTRLCAVANYYNFTTVGSFEDFINRMKPSQKVSVNGMNHTRVTYIQKELSQFKSN